MTDPTRRRFLLMPVAMLLLALQTHGVLAKDGESDGDGGSNSGSGGGDDSGDDNDDGGSNSGSGGGDDHGDDDNDDDDGNESGGSSDGGGAGGQSKDHDRAREAVRRGKAVSLKSLKQHLAAHYPGKVLKVELKNRSGELVYKVRILDARGRLNTYRLNARSLARSKK